MSKRWKNLRGYDICGHILRLVAVIVVALPLAAQSPPNYLGPLTQGEAVSAKTTGATNSGAEAVSSPVYFDVMQFSGFPDWCAQVSAAYQAAISINGNKGVVLATIANGKVYIATQTELDA